MNLTDCDRLFDKIRSSSEPEVIASGFRKLFDFYPLLNYSLGRGSFYWRGRKSTSDGFSSADRLHCPPPEVTNTGRLNDKGAPCLYAATRKTTVFRELDAKEGDYFHVVAIRIRPEKSIRIITIGDLFNVFKTGKTRFLGREVNQALSRMLNSHPDRELATRILYVDAFLGELLADKEAKDSDYLTTRILASTAYEKSGADGMFYPSVQDHVGMNLSILPEAYYSGMHIVCSQVIRINSVHSYGFYDYEITKHCEKINESNCFVWGNVSSDRHSLLFDLTEEEIDFANSRDEKDPNLMLDLIAFAGNSEQTLKNKYSNFPEDIANPGWVKGWGVIRSAPWHFAGLFLYKEEADALRSKLGAGYRVANGSHRIGSDDFISHG
ncbi:MAG: hypothetical protein EPN17_11915 [Methylobacter sp.]|nr:MAG: hypothetical protein EPN17_11915 [Methylobacter sp.]